MARLVRLVALVSYIVAQGAATPSDVPPCVINCSQASCPDDELQCICVSHTQDINLCVISNCTAADQAAASDLAAQECGISPKIISPLLTPVASIAPARSSAVASVVESGSIISLRVSTDLSLSSTASEVLPAGSSLHSKVESAVSSAKTSAHKGSAGASGDAGGAGASVIATSFATETLSLKAGSLFAFVGILIGFLAI